MDVTLTLGIVVVEHRAETEMCSDLLHTAATSPSCLCYKFKLKSNLVKKAAWVTMNLSHFPTGPIQEAGRREKSWEKKQIITPSTSFCQENKSSCECDGVSSQHTVFSRAFFCESTGLRGKRSSPVSSSSSIFSVLLVLLFAARNCLLLNGSLISAEQTVLLASPGAKAWWDIWSSSVQQTL